MPAALQGDTVMLSLVVDQMPTAEVAHDEEQVIEEWFKHVTSSKDKIGVAIEREPFTDYGSGINAVIVRDPSGYLVEILRFVK
mgnify:FL=1